MSAVQVQLPFGRSQVAVDVPEGCLLGVFEPREDVEEADETALLRAALARPVGTPQLRDLARPGQKVALVTSDLTRPCPSERLLPGVLEELSAAGIPAADVTIVMALGLHRPMTTAELEVAVGTEVFQRVQVINHDPADVVRLGITAAGTPVEIYRPVVEADLRVCLGNLEFHYFVGYSGGVKALLPGCASRATVTANHGMMVHPGARVGELEDNPVRADIEEGVAMLGVDFILNVLVDGHHRIVGAVAGHPQEAHRQGCELVRQRGTVPIPQRADIVLVSAGGDPKDVDLYQAQKALDNAAGAVREGGIIIWAAECREGFGNQTFETWIRQAHSPDQVLDRIQREFVLGGHKAAAIASVMQKARIYLVSALSPEIVQDCGLVPFTEVGQAFAAALAEMGPQARVIALPQGGSVLPVVDPQEGLDR